MNSHDQQHGKRRMSRMTALLSGMGIAVLGYGIGAMLAGRQMDAVVIGCGVVFLASLIPLIDEHRRRGQSSACSRGQ